MWAYTKGRVGRMFEKVIVALSRMMLRSRLRGLCCYVWWECGLFFGRLGLWVFRWTA